jgi:ABC-2 type transport system permease protein
MAMAMAMAAADADAGAGGAVGVDIHLREQILVLARRSTLRTLRQPGALIFPLAFPLILLAVNASGLTAATRLPGFPTHSYLAFALAVPFLQGALFASINAGTDIAVDVESGFFNRLALTPLRGSALLAGQIGGQVVVASIAACVYLIVGMALGVDIAAGFGGALVLLLLAVMLGFAFASLGALIALWLGSAEAVQGFFPLLFVLIFLSSSNLPRNLIQTAWFREIATYNPVSYFIEGYRSLIITGFNARSLALAFGLAAALAVCALAGAGRMLRTRLVRT